MSDLMRFVVPDRALRWETRESLVERLLDKVGRKVGGLPHTNIVIDGQLYMTRWHLIKTKWFRLRVHHILLPDYGRHLHDHPFSFLSWLAKGCYDEVLPDGHTVNRPRWSLAFRQAEMAHHISDLTGDVWTIVATGRCRRDWGFYVDGQWVSADEYDGLGFLTSNYGRGGYG